MWMRIKYTFPAESYAYTHIDKRICINIYAYAKRICKNIYAYSNRICINICRSG